MAEYEGKYKAEPERKYGPPITKPGVEPQYDCEKMRAEEVLGPQPDIMRDFDTGATRSALLDKLMYSRFLSPRVLRRYCEYLHEHRKQADGNIREPDNWKKGIDEGVYVDSNLRHSWDVWEIIVEGREATDKEYEDALCAMLFNTMGLLFEQLTAKGEIHREDTPVYEP